MKNLKLVILTFSSKRRLAILKVFGMPMTPTQVAKKVKMFHPEITVNHCSDTLRWFEQKGIAKCVNPEKRKGRLYVLSAIGEDMRNAFLKSEWAQEI
jgi:hypothetical protein